MENYIRSYQNLTENDQEIEGRIFEFDTLHRDIEGRDEKIPSTCQIEISPRCLALRSHDQSQILGKKGINLQFVKRDDGLYFRLKRLGTRLWDDTRELIKNKIFNGCSAGFTAEPIYKDNIRTFDKLTLNEVSIVDTPAYESSYVHARSKDLPKSNKTNYPPGVYL